MIPSLSNQHSLPIDNVLGEEQRYIQRKQCSCLKKILFVSGSIFLLLNSGRNIRVFEGNRSYRNIVCLCEALSLPTALNYCRGRYKPYSERRRLHMEWQLYHIDYRINSFSLSRHQKSLLLLMMTANDVEKDIHTKRKMWRGNIKRKRIRSLSDGYQKVLSKFKKQSQLAVPQNYTRHDINQNNSTNRTLSNHQDEKTIISGYKYAASISTSENKKVASKLSSSTHEKNHNKKAIVAKEHLRSNTTTSIVDLLNKNNLEQAKKEKKDLSFSEFVNANSAKYFLPGKSSRKYTSNYEKVTINGDTSIVSSASATSNTKNTTRPRVLNTSLPKSSSITVKDLETILYSNGFLRKMEIIDLIQRESSRLELKSSRGRKSGSKISKGQVAFPQPSELTNKAIIVGTTLSAAIMSAILGITIYPGFWLVGLVVGSNIGNRIATSSISEPNISMNLFSELVLRFGKRISKIYLECYDFFQGVWYLYKTGQLSYDYMKQYQALDEKFKIQAKVDAWNARFQKGKKNFDKWEKENEVSRKILAGLRTVWLIEENSLKNVSNQMKRKKKYRLVELLRQSLSWFGQLVFAIWDAIRGGGFSELRDIINGVKISFAEIGWEKSARMIGSGFLAFFTINLLVGIFEVSPKVISSIAFLVGVLWPEWFQSTYRNIKDLLSGTAAKSRADKESLRVAVVKKPDAKSSSSVTGVSNIFVEICEQIFPKVDKEEEVKPRFIDRLFPGKIRKATVRKRSTPIFRRRRKQKQVWGGYYER